MDSVQRYFAFLDDRIGEIRKDREETISIRICGRLVRLRFVNIRPDRVLRINLERLSAADEEPVDEEAFIWEDSLDRIAPGADMIPMDRRSLHYHQGADYKLLFPGVVKRQASRDIRRRRTYITFENGHVYPESYINKPFVNEMQWWLEDHYYLMHGALVGMNGNGALITAPSGKGKSTLALSGLVCGMDYISEDYVLVSREGELLGHFIFPTGFMLEDTLEMLPDLKSGILLYDRSRNKYLVDLSRYKLQFKDHLRIRCLIYPEVTDRKDPVIRKSDNAFSFMQAVKTTVKQINADKYSDYFMKLFVRFKDVPSYRFDLTRDTMKNAEYLKMFMEEIGDGQT